MYLNNSTSCTPLSPIIQPPPCRKRIVGLFGRSSPDGKYFGVEVLKSQIANMFDLDVIEPLRVKKQAISSAGESAQMILRIDDVISGSGKGKGMPPDMGGMGGMPPGMM